MTTPNSPIVNAGLLYVNGLGIAKTAAKIISLAAGASRDVTNTDDIILNALVSINGSKVGANGVDIAAIVASSFYAVYVVADSTDKQATAGLLSLNATTPSLPFGYDMYRRMGWVLTDGSANILQFYQYGSGQNRMYYYDVGISVLSGGSSTTYANVDLSTAVPPITTEVLFKVAYTPNAATNVAHFLPFASSTTNGIVQFGYGVAAAQVGMAVIPETLNVAAPTIQYKVSASDALTLLVGGFKDQL